jgi:membrane protein required for beta-lactamase induction
LKQKRDLERATIRLWETWLIPNDLQHVRFDSVFRYLYVILGLRVKTAGEITSKTSAFIDAFEAEKERFDKAES